MTPPQENTNVAPQQDMAVLDQVKKQRGKVERLTTEQILEKALEGTDQNPMKVQAALAQLVNNDPKFRILRSHNTLFMYYNQGNGNVFAFMETADSPRNLVAAISDAAQAMKTAGFKTGTIVVANPQILKALQMANVKYTIQQGKGMMEDGKTPQQNALVEF